QRGKIAALMVYARHAIADKLPGNECQAFTAALQRLFRSVGRPRTDPVEWVPCTVGNPSVEVTVRIAIIGSAGRIRRCLIDVRHCQSFAVVERRVAAAMM